MRARRFSVGSHLLYRFGPGAAMDKNRALPEIGAFAAACLVFEQEAPFRLYFSHGKKNAHCEKRRNLL